MLAFCPAEAGLHLMRVGLHRMRVETSVSTGPAGGVRDERARAALALVFGEDVRPLMMRDAVFEAALSGWARQQSARHLAEATKRRSTAMVRRFRSETELFPWEWQAIHVDEWLEDLAAPPSAARSRRCAATRRRCDGFLTTSPTSATHGSRSARQSSAFAPCRSSMSATPSATSSSTKGDPVDGH